MERIMLSKMNSEVQAMYVSGHNKFEGTARDLIDKQLDKEVERIRQDNDVYQKEKRKEIYEKLKKIQEFKQKLVFNKVERKKK